MLDKDSSLEEIMTYITLTRLFSINFVSSFFYFLLFHLLFEISVTFLIFCINIAHTYVLGTGIFSNKYEIEGISKQYNYITNK